MGSAIVVDDLRKTYPAKQGPPVHALDGVSLQVEEGSIFGLLGPNGAGKSTLVKVLSTITPATSGRARVGAFDVMRQPLEARRQMAVVLQQTAAENLLTVRDNLLVYAYLHGLRKREAEARVAAVVEEFELGARLRDTVQELSMGTKRRVQVAKVFMLDTPIVILDEATTGMDPLMKRRVLDRLRDEARRGRTILLTTQVLGEAEELCETMLIINRGRTMAAGSLLELRRRAAQTFRVSLSFSHAAGPAARAWLEAWHPLDLRIDGTQAELLVQGEEASLLDRLAALSRQIPIQQFEVRGPSLEDIFVGLLAAR